MKHCTSHTMSRFKQQLFLWYLKQATTKLCQWTLENLNDAENDILVYQSGMTGCYLSETLTCSQRPCLSYQQDVSKGKYFRA